MEKYVSAHLMEKPRRLVWLDIEKGIAIILVIIAHLELGLKISNGISSVIYKFHMPLFMLITGYITSLIYVKNNKLNKKKLIVQILNSYVVYFFFSSLYCLLKIVTEEGNTEVTIKDFFSILYCPVGHYWYIYTSILLYIFFGLFWKILKNNKIWIILFILEILTFKVTAEVEILKFVPLNYLAAWLPYWHFGVMLESTKGFMDAKIRKKPYDIFLSFVVFGICIWFDLEIFVFTGLIMAYGIFELIYRYSNKLSFMVLKCLVIFGKNCLPIYLLHSYFTFAFTVLSKKIAFLPESVNYVFCCVGLIISVLCCSMLISNRFAFLLSPVKYIVKRREL